MRLRARRSLAVASLPALLLWACAGTESGNPSFDPSGPTPDPLGPTRAETASAGGPGAAMPPGATDAVSQPPAVPACSSGWGQCEPVPGETRFQCSCDYYQVPRASTAPVCSDALDLCRPEARKCQDFTGFCEAVPGGWSCQCVGGTPAFWSGAVYGQDCQGLLSAMCANTQVPVNFTCERSAPMAAELRRGRCVRDYIGETPVFRCACGTTDAAGFKTNEQNRTLPATESCSAILEATCFAP